MQAGQAEQAPRIEAELKRDSFGRVELVRAGELRVLRRWAHGGRLPGSSLVARHLARRERRALECLRGLAGVPEPLEDSAVEALPGLDGRRPRGGECFLRGFVHGEPLHRAERLPRDFFEHLDALVEELHRRGICHNDLHKEQNIVVDEAGYPALIDFQLASIHRAGSRIHRTRCADDLRHLQKHRRRYTRDGRGPADVVREGRGHGVRRSLLARSWRRLGKPLYNALTRGLLGTRDGEERRPSSGPWPEWTEPLGPRRG